MLLILLCLLVAAHSETFCLQDAVNIKNIQELLLIWYDLVIASSFSLTVVQQMKRRTIFRAAKIIQLIVT